MRLLWQAIGWTSLLFGAIGIFLPLLPTAPFLLLSAWCFARSSERFHAWLIGHARLGPPIEAWRREGAISWGAKHVAVLSMAASLVISLLLAVPFWALALQTACLAGGSRLRPYAAIAHPTLSSYLLRLCSAISIRP